MRIISSFHDYYDPIQAYDEDRETLFIRETKEVNIKTVNQSSIFSNVNINYDMVGFCGTVYPLVKHYNSSQTNPFYSYDIDDNLIKSIEEVFNNRYRGRFRRSKYALREKSRQWDGLVKFLASKRHLSKTDPQDTIFYLFSQWSYVINPCLKDIEFYKVKKTELAYQELRMWIENQANPEKPIPYIDDKTMAEAKGLDKYSFRKDKSKI